jgi:hypothetical protein
MSEVNLNFSKSISTYDENSNVIKFIKDFNEGSVEFEIDGEKYELESQGSNKVFKSIEEVWGGCEKDKKGVYWYKNCLDHGINGSSAGTISYFVKNFIAETQKYKDRQISEKELELINSKCIAEF